MSETVESPELLALRERVRAASADEQPLVIQGAGSKAFYGRPPVGELLDTRPYCGVISYEPTELVVTARCGTSLAELDSVLADNNQYLPFEPPNFGGAGTVGGMVAAGLSGPRRAAVGSVRDYVLGTTLINAHGEWLKFGGQVMKNVAGYDVSRLLCGSLGILGLIADVSMKVLPQPATERSLRFAADQALAIRLLNEWGSRPLPITATSWHDDAISVRFSGAASVVDSALREFSTEYEAGELQADYWNDLRHQRLPFFAAAGDQGLPLWRLSLPSTAAVLPLPGDTLHEWGSALRWLRSDAPGEAIRAACHAAGGHASLFRANDKSGEVFDPLPEPLLGIHRRLKAEFDPLAIFNRGRMYASL